MHLSLSVMAAAAFGTCIVAIMCTVKGVMRRNHDLLMIGIAASVSCAEWLVGMFLIVRGVM